MNELGAVSAPQWNQVFFWTSCSLDLSSMKAFVKRLDMIGASGTRPDPIAENEHNVLCVPISDSQDELASMAITLKDTEVPSIAVLRTQRGARIGPARIGAGTACVRCAGDRLTSNGICDETRISDAVPLLDELWQLAIYRELLSLKSPDFQLLTVNHILVCDAYALSFTRHRVLRIPGCPVCCLHTKMAFAPWQTDEL